VLTGGRPALLQRTLAQFFEHTARMPIQFYCFVNGADEDSCKVAFEQCSNALVNGYVISHDAPILPIGAAVTELVANLPDDGVYLHLEDDWSVNGDVKRHIAAAASLLDSTDIAHVKLRYFNDEKTNLSRRGCAIRWEAPEAWYWRSTNASFTFNPALTKLSVVKRVFDCAGEHDAQDKYEELAFPIAQLIPGCFIHTDDGDSLRKRLNRGHRDDLPY
jgi:hypothetical protein